MPLTQILGVAQIAVAVLLMAAILLQQRGTGLGAAFGGEGNVFASRRGAEKILFTATVVLAVLFIAIALAILLV